MDAKPGAVLIRLIAIRIYHKQSFAILRRSVSTGCWGKSMTDSQNVRATWVRQGSSENSIAQGLKFILAILTTTMTLFCPNALAQPNVEWTVSYEHAAPQLDADPIQIENLGNGRYRAVVNALAADGQMCSSTMRSMQPLIKSSGLSIIYKSVGGRADSRSIRRKMFRSLLS